MAVLDPAEITLIIILGAIAAIVYSLRYLVLMERRVAKMDANIEKIANKILKEEVKIERMEKKLIKRTKK